MARIFFNVDFTRLTTAQSKPAANYRNILQKHHKTNPEYGKSLSENPSIPYAIEFILTKDNEFVNSDEMEIKEVKRLLEKYDLVYDGSSLSTELQKSDFIQFRPHPFKKRRNLYKLK